MAAPPIDIADHRTLDVVIWFALIGLFALFGASAKLLYYWHPTPWTRAIGSLMVSVFAAWCVGCLAWRFIETSPSFLFAITGVAAWVGGEIVDRISARLSGIVMSVLPSIKPDDDSEPPS